GGDGARAPSRLAAGRAGWRRNVRGLSRRIRRGGAAGTGFQLACAVAVEPADRRVDRVAQPLHSGIAALLANAGLPEQARAVLERFAGPAGVVEGAAAAEAPIMEIHQPRTGLRDMLR